MKVETDLEPAACAAEVERRRILRRTSASVRTRGRDGCMLGSFLSLFALWPCSVTAGPPSLLSFGGTSRRLQFQFLTGLLLLAAVQTHAQVEMAITNVLAVNVTPSQFSVFFQTGSETESRIEIFADAGGSVNLAGTLGVELYALELGNSGTTNAAAARESCRALCGGMSGKGLAIVRVSSCVPGTTYYFRLSASTGGVVAATWPEGGGLQAVRTATENAFVADARQLLVSVPGDDANGCVGVLDYVGAAYPLASVVGDRAGEGELHFDLSNFFGAGGTNLVFSGDEEFSIRVYGSSALPRTDRDYDVVFGTNAVVAEAIPLISDATYLVVGMGSTSILSNVTGADVPISVVSAPETTNLTFELTIPAFALTDLVVNAVAPEIGTARVEPLGGDRWRVVLEAAPGSLIHSTSLEEREVARLQFSPTPDVLTVLVPLSPAVLRSLSPTNEIVAGGISEGGSVQIITRRPFVQWQGDGFLEGISVSGIPGTDYSVEYSTNILIDVWETVTNFSLQVGELQTDVELPPHGGELLFIRIRESTAP